MNIQPQPPLKIMIGTPCGGGKLSTQYLGSIMDTTQRLSAIKQQIYIRDNLRVGKQQGQLSPGQAELLAKLEALNMVQIELAIYTLSQESLLCRGRNHIAAEAIRGGWDKLFFIDADAKWDFSQFMALALSNEEFIAGACPVKVLPISLNYLPFEEDMKYHTDNARSIDSLLRTREGHGKSIFPVGKIGTAFMCVSRKVLLACAEDADEYLYPNPRTGHLYTHWNMFDTKVQEGRYMSEDWAMCERAIRLGFNVMLHSEVVISHVGDIIYSPQMAQITHVPKEEGVMSDSEPVKKGVPPSITEKESKLAMVPSTESPTKELEGAAL